MSTSVIYPAVTSGTTTLAIPFSYLNPAEVVVMSRPVAGDDEIIFTGTTLVLGTDWTFGTSSTVVLGVAADGAHDYQVARVTPRSAYTTQQPGAFSSAAVNTNFTQLEDIEQEQDDQISYLAQETQGALSRAVRGQLGETLPALPAAGSRAGLYLSFDVHGNPVTSPGTGTDSGLRTALAASTGWSLVGCGAVSLQNYLTAQAYTITTINASITTLNGSVSTINAEITTLNSEVATLTPEVVTLNSEVATLIAEVAALTTEVATLTAEVAAMPPVRAWSNVTGSRLADTLYTNSRAYEIEVMISVQSNSSGPNYSGTLVVGGVTVAAGFVGGSYTGGASRQVSAQVPAGATYEITLGSYGSIQDWAEYF